MSAEQLTKDDLVNMMESYKSNIEFNKQLFSSQEKILTDHNKVIENLGEIIQSQEKLGIHLEHLVDRIIEHNNSCTDNFNSAVQVITAVGEKVDTGTLEQLKSTNGLRGHMIAIYGSMGGVIVSLIGLIYTIIKHP